MITTILLPIFQLIWDTACLILFPTSLIVFISIVSFTLAYLGLLLLGFPLPFTAFLFKLSAMWRSGTEKTGPPRQNTLANRKKNHQNRLKIAKCRRILRTYFFLTLRKEITDDFQNISVSLCVCTYEYIIKVNAKAPVYHSMDVLWWMSGITEEYIVCVSI